MPGSLFSKQLEKVNEAVANQCRETDPKKRRAAITKILTAKVDPAVLNSYPVFTENGALITDRAEQERRGRMTTELRRQVLEQQMARGTKKRKFPALMQRTGNLYYYFHWFGHAEIAEDFDRVMTVSRESRQEQILRLRAEGMTKEDAENATDTQRKQAAMARGNMLKELVSQFKDTTKDSLLTASDEEIVRLYPLFSYMNDLSLNMDDLYESQADEILLTDEARRLCQHLSDLMEPLRKVMSRAELIFSPYYQYLDDEKLSAKCREDIGGFLEQFPEFGNNASYLGVYGMMINQANSQAEDQAPKKDYREKLCEKLAEQAREQGLNAEQLSYSKPDGTELEYGSVGLGQYLYEGEPVLVSDGAHQMEAIFRNGKPLVKEQTYQDAEPVAELNENDLAAIVEDNCMVYVNRELKTELNDVVRKVRKADPQLMISSPQYREMRAKLKEFAEIYQHTSEDFALKDPSMIRKQQKLLCELLTKSNAYLRYKGTTSNKTSEQKRINAAKSIQDFAKQRLADLDCVEKESKKLIDKKNAVGQLRRKAEHEVVPPQNDAENVIVPPQNEEDMRRRFFQEAGRSLNQGKWRLFRENANTIAITKQLTEAFADDGEHSIYDRLGLADGKKDHKQFNAQEKVIVGEFLENAMIKQLLSSEQQNIRYYLGEDGGKVCGPYELLTQMRPMTSLKDIIKKSGVIDNELKTMTRQDLIEMVEEQPAKMRLFGIFSEILKKTENIVLEERKKILAEHKELGAVENDPRNWVMQKPAEPKAEHAHEHTNNK